MLCYRCGSHVPDGSAKCATCGQTFAGGSRRPGGPPKPPKRGREIDVPGAFELGDRLGDRYEIQSIIGQGPVGIVYGALDREVDVEVAVKLVTPKLLQTQDERAAFRREAKVARGLSHPNIVRLYEEGLDGDRPYQVMQHLEGLTLRKIIDLRHTKGQRFSLKEVEPILSQLAAALDYAHAQTVDDVRGVAHGHLKPENVIVLPDLLKVTDFREACFVPRVPFVAAQKVRGGGERYLAPEVVAGQAITPAADLYSLGVLFGEMLAGEVYDPSRGLDLHVVSPGLPRSVDSIFKRLTAPRPEDRYARAGQVADDVTAVLAGQMPQATGRSPSPPPMPKTAPVIAAADEEILHTGEFELLDEDEGEAPGRKGGRVSYGLEAEAPPAVKADLEVLEDDILDDDILEASDLEAQIAHNPPPAIVGERMLAPSDDAADAGTVDDAPFADDEAIALGDEDLLEADADADEAPATGGAKGRSGAAVLDADAFSSRRPAPRPRSAGSPGAIPGPGADAPVLEAPMFSALASRRGPKRSRWKPYALLVLAGLVGGAVAMSFTGPGKALLARLTTSSPTPTPSPATGPSPTAVMDQTGGGTGKPVATGTTATSKTPAGTAKAAGTKTHAGGAGTHAVAVHRPVETGSHPGEGHRHETHPKVHHPEVRHVVATHGAGAGGHETHPETGTHHAVATTGGGAHGEGGAQGAHGGGTGGATGPGHGGETGGQGGTSGGHGGQGGETGGHGGREVASLTPTTTVPTHGRCPKGMVYVPAGSFKIGSSLNDPMRNFAEKKLHSVDVKAYCIDRYEYGGRGRRPLTSVTWYRAKSLCNRRGKRLCSEAEWEKACKGPHDYRFPYGNVFRPNACNTEDAQGNDRHVEAGGSFPACRSGYGVLDMSGNVSEWTSSKFQAHLSFRTQKGGAANRPDWDTRCAARGNLSPNAKSSFLGFRCCANPK